VERFMRKIFEKIRSTIGHLIKVETEWSPSSVLVSCTGFTHNTVMILNPVSGFECTTIGSLHQFQCIYISTCFVLLFMFTHFQKCVSI
jgi:hypothetical protein